jgi:hypothetical protein
MLLRKESCPACASSHGDKFSQNDRHKRDTTKQKIVVLMSNLTVLMQIWEHFTFAHKTIHYSVSSITLVGHACVNTAVKIESACTSDKAKSCILHACILHASISSPIRSGKTVRKFRIVSSDCVKSAREHTLLHVKLKTKIHTSLFLNQNSARKVEI